MTPGELVTSLGFLIGGGVFYWQAKERNYATEGVWILVLVGLVFGALGAKVAQLAFTQIPADTPILALFDPRSGGRTVIAGVLIGWGAVEVAKWRLGIKRSTGDAFALALSSGEAIGRIGCFLNPCCIGKACDLPIAVLQAGEFRHPTQLYQSAILAVTFLVLLPLRNRLPQGGLFQLYLLLWAGGRFGVEFFREHDHLYGGLSIAQWFCIQTAILAGVVLVVKLRKERRGHVNSSSSESTKVQ